MLSMVFSLSYLGMMLSIVYKHSTALCTGVSAVFLLSATYCQRVNLHFHSAHLLVFVINDM